MAMDEWGEENPGGYGTVERLPTMWERERAADRRARHEAKWHCVLAMVGATMVAFAYMGC